MPVRSQLLHRRSKIAHLLLIILIIHLLCHHILSESLSSGMTRFYTTPRQTKEEPTTASITKNKNYNVDVNKHTVSKATESFHSLEASNDTVTTSSFREGYKALMRDILARDVVKERIPPYLNSSTPLNVFMQPYQVVNVDDDDQTINLKVTFSVSWRDPQLTWLPGDYAGHTSVKIPSWTPLVIVPQAVKNDPIDLPEQVWVSHDGSVGVSDTYVLELLCFMDMRFFPFDKHRCNLSFIFEKGFYPIFVREDNFKNFTTTGEWWIKYYECLTSTGESNESKFITCHLDIHRKSTFYIANIVAPMTLTSGVTLMVFLIPAESGEKTSFLLNTYITTSVYLNFIVTFLPKSMERIPKINLLLLVQVFTIILATLATLVVMARYKRSLHKKEAEHKNAVTRFIKKYSTKHADASRSHLLEEFIAVNVKVAEAESEKVVREKPIHSTWRRLRMKLALWFTSWTHTQLDLFFLISFTAVTIVIHVVLLYQ